MIGARPYVLTIVAAALIALAVLDVIGTDARAHPGPCAAGARSYAANDYTAARRAYAKVIADDPSSKCAAAGVIEVDRAVCALTRRLAASDPSAARRELEAVAVATPAPTESSRIWSTLEALPS